MRHNLWHKAYGQMRGPKKKNQRKVFGTHCIAPMSKVGVGCAAVTDGIDEYLL